MLKNRLCFVVMQRFTLAFAQTPANVTEKSLSMYLANRFLQHSERLLTINY